MNVLCPHCDREHWIDGERPEDLLRELVELKRMKDSNSIISDQDRRSYENRKHIAWCEAFKLLGIIERPKP